MTSKENPCKNFAANIFDKNKCQNCFKPRDTHAHLTKDLSKAKPIYYGWLLLAPIGTDFANIMHKNRKWQRRWFVLFEHGALRYALDDNASTVAQATIDMNVSTDVELADNITEQKHTLCIYTPNQNYYLRGGNKEEIVGWRDALVIFPQTIKEEMRRKKKLKNRRSEVPLSSTTRQVDEAKSSARSRTMSSSQVPSSITSPTSSSDVSGSSLLQSFSIPIHQLMVDHNDDQQENRPPKSSSAGTTPVEDTRARLTVRKTCSDTKLRDSRRSDRCSLDSTLESNKHLSSSTSSLDSTSGHSFLSESTVDSSGGFKIGKHRSTMKDRLVRAGGNPTINESPNEQQLEKNNSYPRSRNSGKKRDRPKSAFISDASHKDMEESILVGSKSGSDISAAAREERRGRNISRRSTQAKQGTQSNKKTTSSTSSVPGVGRPTAAMRRAKSLDRRVYDEITVSPDLFNVKNGLLTVINEDETWTKHWFVLANNVLCYYKDSASEHSDKPEGEIDLSKFQDVYEVDVQRRHGFQLVTSESVHKLVAVTSGIRRGWMNAILRATSSLATGGDSDGGQPKSSSVTSHQPPTQNNTTQEIESDIIRPSTADTTSSTVTTSPPSGRSREELSNAERAARRKQRIRDRKREGRARTFDFAEMRKSENSKRESSDLVTKLTGSSDSSKTTLGDKGKSNENYIPMEARIYDRMSIRQSNLIDSKSKFENAWKKIEKIGLNVISGEAQKNPLGETANMVKSLQNEIDSLKMQIERVQIKSPTPNDRQDVADGVDTTVDDGGHTTEDTTRAITSESKTDEILKENIRLMKELLEMKETVKKQNRLLGEREIRLETMRSDSEQISGQLCEVQHQLEQERRMKNNYVDQVALLSRRLVDKDGELSTAKLDYEEELEALRKRLHSGGADDRESDGDLKEKLKMKEKELIATRGQLEKTCHEQQIMSEKFAQALMKMELQQTSNTANSPSSSSHTTTELPPNLSNNESLTDQVESSLPTSVTSQISSFATVEGLDEDCDVFSTPTGSLSHPGCRKSSSYSQSSFRDKLNELEAEMGGTGQMIAAARKNASELPNNNKANSPTSNTFDQHAHFLKIKKAEDDLAKQTRTIMRVQEQFNQFQYQQQRECRERWAATQKCLRSLHTRVTATIEPSSSSSSSSKLLADILTEIVAIASGGGVTSQSVLSSACQHTSTSSSSTAETDEPPRLDDDGVRRKLEVAKNLHDLAERLDKDGGLQGFVSQQQQQQQQKDRGDELFDDEEAAEVLFIKQISTQALLLAQMAAAIRSLDNNNTTATQHKIQQSTRKQSTSSSADFSTSYLSAQHETPNLLRHVDDLARKLKLGGTLMQEIDVIRKNNRKQQPHHEAPTLPPAAASTNKKPPNEFADVGIALAAHSQISYTLQVYNERISRLSYDLGQSRHKANAAMRKLVELVDACKMKDLETVSKLAVQVDIDSITSSYPELSPWQQQIDYGTLHGAQSVTGSSSSSAAASSSGGGGKSQADSLEEEAAFFDKLARDLSCMSIDFKSLIKNAAQIIKHDNIIQSFSRDQGNMDDLASTVAMEAIIQSEIIYVAHRLRQDYEEELKKMKNVSSELSKQLVVCGDKNKEMTKNEKRMKSLVDDGNLKLQTLSKLHKNLESKLHAAEKKAKELEEKVKKMNKEKDKEAVALKNQLEEMRKKLEKKSKDYARKEETHAEKLNESKKSQQTLLQEHHNKLEQANNKHKAEVHKLKSAYLQEMDSLKASYEKKLRTKDEESKGKILVDIRKVEQQLVEKHSKEIEQLLTDHRQATAELRAERETMEKEKERSDKLMQAHFEKKLKLERNELQRIHENDLLEQEARLKATWDKEVAKSRSHQESKENESTRVLQQQIRVLEEKIESKEGQHSSAWKHMEAIGKESYEAIKRVHQKQIDEMKSAHDRELEHLREEHRIFIEADKQDTRKAIEVMRKFHADQADQIRRTNEDGDDGEDHRQLKEELETVSEQFSRKCVQLEKCLEKSVKMNDRMENLERENDRLQLRLGDINKVYEEGTENLSGNPTDNKLYELQMELRVKSSQVEYLEGVNCSLNKELDQQLQEMKSSQRKQQKMFDDMSLAKSRENALKRELSRVRESGGHHGNAAVTPLPTPAEYQKSPSQPDLPRSGMMHNVKRTNSDRM